MECGCSQKGKKINVITKLLSNEEKFVKENYLFQAKKEELYEEEQDATYEKSFSNISACTYC